MFNSFFFSSEDEDNDDNSDIDEDTMPEVFPSSPNSLLSKGTNGMQRIDAFVAINKNLYDSVFRFYGNSSPCHSWLAN